MEQLTAEQPSEETAPAPEASASTVGRGRRTKRKMKAPVRTQEELVPLPGEMSLAQVKSEHGGDSSLPEASCSKSTGGPVKVGQKRKGRKKKKPSSEPVPRQRVSRKRKQKTPTEESDTEPQEIPRKRCTKKKVAGVEFLKNMERSPEKRKVSVVSKDIEGKQVCKKKSWSREETHRLLEALEKYGAADWKNVLMAVPTRPRKEIMAFYKKLKTKYEKNTAGQYTPKAPIEHWLQAAQTTTMFDYDYSAILSQIMSMAGYLEPHDPPRTKMATDPDWSRIYQYLAQLMAKEEEANPQNLSPIEAAVLLDLLQNLSDYLNSLNTTKQRALMEKKYEQILQNTAMLRKTKEEETLYHGLDKDPLVETIPPYVPAGESGTTSGTQPSTSVPKKSKLFSINPFSIPVKYLRPGPQQ